MKTAVVTGGLGFIGSNLIKLLNQKNYYVINIDKCTYASNVNNIDSKIKNYKFFKLDINKIFLLKNILNKYKPQIIFNLAAETHVDKSIENPITFIKSNYLGVFSILEFIRTKKIKTKLIHMSTDEVFGSVKWWKKSKEEDTYKPSSPYSSSKAGADLLIKSYIKTYNSSAIITNSCNNYGPNQDPEKFIPTVILQTIKKRDIPVYGKGKNEREWIYVEDNCKALIDVAEKGKLGESYNIGSGEVYTNLEIARKIIEIIGNGKIKFVKDRPGHDLRYSLDSKKIKNLIGWKPSISIDEGLKTTIKWYINKFKSNFFKKKIIGKRLGLLK